MSSATHYRHHQEAAGCGRISSDKVANFGIPAPGPISWRAVRNSLITLHSGPCCFRAALAKSLCLNVALLGCPAHDAHGLGKTTHSLAASAKQEVQAPRCLRGSWLCFQLSQGGLIYFSPPLFSFFVIVANESIFMDPKFHLTISDLWNMLG